MEASTEDITVNLDHYDKDKLEQFLTLFLHKYQLADQSNYFLEGNFGVSGVNLSIANQRDAVSHFISFLKETNRGKEDANTEQQAFWRAQLDASEEHLRRATMEPYQLAIAILDKDINALLEEYIKTLRYYDTKRLSGKEITKRLGEIQELYASGRSKKTQNSWNAEWESGTKDLTLACGMAQNLKIELQERCSDIRHIMHEELKKKNDNSKYFIAFASSLAIALVACLIII